MDSSSWMPHGLIQKKSLEKKYQNAKRSVDRHGNLIDPKDYKTVNLFEGVFLHVVFPPPHFETNSQVPPSDTADPDMACNLATGYIDNHDDWHAFCFSEAKTAKNTPSGKIQELEDQALKYCKEYVRVQPNVGLVYANTLVGASIRCWYYSRGDETLGGFWDGQFKGSFKYYKDIGEDRNRSLIEFCFNQMKAVPLGALHRGQDQSQIGASFAFSPFQEPSHILQTQTPTGYTTSTSSEQVSTWRQEPDPMPVDTGGPSNTVSLQSITLEDTNYTESQY